MIKNEYKDIAKITVKILLNQKINKIETANIRVFLKDNNIMAKGEFWSYGAIQNFLRVANTEKLINNITSY